MPASSNDSMTRLYGREPTLWWNAARGGASFDPEPEQAYEAAIGDASARFERFAPLIARLFPETAAAGGRIRSRLIPADRLRAALGLPTASGRFFVKGDHELPIVGSIKARGGIHAVLAIAEEVARERGLSDGLDIARLADEPARQAFSTHRVSVGSTGNLGLSVGTMAAALGFGASVHMSSEAKGWKKRLLRERGAEVVEHAGDYGQALAAARSAVALEPACTFIDDEASTPLLYGYAVAARELADQLANAGVLVDGEHPLIVHLPCGVGGAPTGIALGLDLIFGANVHCIFAEPVDSPAFTLQMQAEPGSHPSIYDVGLSGRTEADGLAVPRASLLAVGIARTVLAGTITVTDKTLLRHLHLAADTEGLRLEPSAAAGIGGAATLHNQASEHLPVALSAGRLERATQVVWATGGRLMPEGEYALLVERGAMLHRAGSV